MYNIHTKPHSMYIVGMHTYNIGSSSYCLSSASACRCLCSCFCFCSKPTSCESGSYGAYKTHLVRLVACLLYTSILP